MNILVTIYTRFFNKVYSPMLLAEAEVSGETGNDSDGDGIPYVAGGTVATVFAAEAEYSFIVTSVNQQLQQASSLNIYPNPISDQATISFENEGYEQINILVMNIAGQKVQVINNGIGKNERTISWNTQGLTNGIYFVRIDGDGKTLATKKVVVNR